MGLRKRRAQRTIRAWVSCFGKPLLCVIESGEALNGYLYESDEGTGRPLDEVQRFPRKAIVGVDEKET